MGGYARQLSALGYPQRASFSCDDAQQCRYLIVWLELTKIRQWTEEQREALKRVDHPTWSAALQHYVSSLSPPLVGSGWSASSSSSAPLPLRRVLSLLLRYAVAAEFADQSAAINAAAQQRLDEASRGQQRGSAGVAGEGGAGRLAWRDDAELRAAVKQLCSQLQLPDPDCLPFPPSTLSLLHSLRALLDAHMSATQAAPSSSLATAPSTALSSSSNAAPSPPSSSASTSSTSSSSSTSQASALAFLHSLPLGLAVDDETVADLGRGLRLLSGREMKAIQERVTQCMHMAQTQGKGGRRALGRVDMSRGQVGR